MTKRRVLQGGIALILALGLLPSATAFAAVNKPPRMLKAEMKDMDADGMADRVVLTYSEKINHKLDVSRFPFQVQGHKILKVNGARRSLRLTIMLAENSAAPAKPASIKYVPTRQQPVLDLRKKQAMKQLLTKNITGLAAAVKDYTLTVTKAGDGLGQVTSSDSKINCGTTCSANYAAGSVVTLTAAADAASKAEFAGWTGGGCGTATSCEVTMDAAKTITATFNKTGSLALTVVKAGPGAGTVTSTSAPSQSSQINCGATCTASYPKATVVTLSAAADTATSSTFGGWSGGGCTGTATTCNVTMDVAKTVTVTFNKVGSFALTVTKSGDGTVTSTSSPTQTSQINCGATCSASYPAGTTVTLTAAPDTSKSATFTGWSGGGCSGASATCNVTMDAAKTVSAAFSSATQHALTVAKAGTGQGTVTSNQTPAINCGSSCTANYPQDTVVTLTATVSSGSTFAGWSGDATCGTTPNCDVVMSAAKNVTATFNLQASSTTKTLSVTATNGTVACVPAAPAGGCNGTYTNGTSVVITAMPTVGMDPLSVTWTGCTPPLPDSLTCTVTMDIDRVVSVSFSAIAPLTGASTTTGVTPPLPLPTVPDVTVPTLPLPAVGGSRQ